MKNTCISNPGTRVANHERRTVEQEGGRGKSVLAEGVPGDDDAGGGLSALAFVQSRQTTVRRRRPVTVQRNAAGCIVVAPAGGLLSAVRPAGEGYARPRRIITCSRPRPVQVTPREDARETGSRTQCAPAVKRRRRCFVLTSPLLLPLRVHVVVSLLYIIRRSRPRQINAHALQIRRRSGEERARTRVPPTT